ncbi:23S rRNA (adenine(2030)-N(6))-methyltransferase RlmJ [Labrys sp. KNU-23]|uniref:23S rRNA (adenine(2030)-N(6))-methyltransferase RlmJ n=1 Tax=Labrys sp. KNU-23 TaxID=2789216 RepID=UPI0011EE3929|nr:23S rRNA (adenine(2030)-N(6))-methyltransferase RlmJ [Labrys sp. KNU-23]QEN90057.1 23S rRNA (adenine(2030)-N(6))-methyltransferase RlmJ [Labrys sp. KNU-23]
MNYRHAFHAGNFADVLKHIVLARILTHLKAKDAPFRVIDTHAGTGLYNLEASEARRTGEWREGIGLVAENPPPARVAELIAPWYGLCQGLMAQSPPLYPGSPWLAADLTRDQDRLVFCEKHPEDADRLRDNFDRSKRVKVMEGDAWSLLPGLLPPPERRGLVFIDPPFEEDKEFRAIAEGLAQALRRWATGVYAIWYPIKGMREVESFARKVAALPAAGRILRFELSRYAVQRIDRLNGCGMIILNPPWKLDEELRAVGDYLAPLFAKEGSGLIRLDWLKEEDKR